MWANPKSLHDQRLNEHIPVNLDHCLFIAPGMEATRGNVQTIFILKFRMLGDRLTVEWIFDTQSERDKEYVRLKDLIE